MKTFAEVRRGVTRNKSAVHGKLVKKLKVGTHTVEIQKGSDGKFHAHIDGDMLDKYLTQAQAEKMARAFIKQAEM
jgi:hypothetical protein